MESDEIIKRERNYTASASNQLKDNKINESVKVVFSIDKDKKHCNSREKELNDRDVDIDIDIDVMLENEHPQISVTVCKKGLASDMITIRKLSCPNSDQWESCVTEELRNGPKSQYNDNKGLIYKKAENKSTTILSEDAIKNTTITEVDTGRKYGNLESIMATGAGEEKNYKKIEMSFEEIINEYNRIFNRPSKLLNLHSCSINAGQIGNTSKRFEKWCQQAEVNLRETEPVAKVPQMKQVKRELELHNGLRYKADGKRFKDPVNIKHTRIPTRVPTEKANYKYTKATITTNTEKEAEDTDVREREISTENLIDGYFMTKEIKNTEEDFKGKTVQLEGASDIEQEHIAIGFATDISVDEYFKPRGRGYAANTIQYKDISNVYQVPLDEYPKRREATNVEKEDNTIGLIGSISKNTQISMDFPTEEAIDQYLKPRETENYAKEESDSMNVKQTQISIRIPKEKFTEEYVPSGETRNIQKGIKNNIIQYAEQTQTVIADITSTPIKKHLAAREIGRTDQDTVKLKCPHNIKETQAVFGVGSNAANSSFIPSSLKNNTKNRDSNTAMKLQTEPFVTKNTISLKTLSAVEEEDSMGIGVKNANWKVVPKLKTLNGSFAEKHTGTIGKELQSIINGNISKESDDLEMIRKLSVISEEEIRDNERKNKAVPTHNKFIGLFTDDRTNRTTDEVEKKYLSADKLEHAVNIKTNREDLERAKRLLLINGLPTEENANSVQQSSEGKMKHSENVYLVRQKSKGKSESEHSDVTQGKNKELEDIKRIQKLDELIKTLWPEEKNEDGNTELQNTELINLFQNTSFSNNVSFQRGTDRTNEMYPVKV